ncbi:MAG: glycoside hydrolase family 31 protein [Anaerolineae bacterium]|nr:glycoside hydrolase family 31 protein [Anaerolineae bacterium]
MKTASVSGSIPVIGGALIEVDDALLEMRFVAANVLRVRLAPGGEFREEETFTLAHEPMPYAAATFIATDAAITITTGELRAEIIRHPFTLRLLDAQGRLIAATPADVPAIEWDGARRVQRLALPPGVGVYGLGQGAFSRLNLRGLERRMWQEWNGFRHSGNAGIPLMLTTAGYGLLLNSSWPSRWVIGEGEPAPAPMRPEWAPCPWPHGEPSGEGHPERLTILLDGGELDIFFLYGPDFDRILASYTMLTGQPSLPPRWALGLIQCKNRYRSAEELTYIAREYRRRGLPCDVLVIDWHWFEHFGDLAWVEQDWPDPAATMRELREMGFRVMQAQHPFVEKRARTFHEFHRRGFLVDIPNDHRMLYDHSNPQARAAWWTRFRPIWRQGIRAFWTDMGEAEIHPIGAQHFLGSRERVHNVYSLLWSKGLYENQRRESDLRVCALARTAWAGIPRYGTLMWSGDIATEWEVLRDQVVVGQEVCLSGQPYWTTDIGGFFTTTGFSPELYVRWFEWGTFCPIFRTHGTRPGNEPWTFGPQVEAICARYIRLRYRLLPYIYACARRTYESGQPFMRAMVMDFGDDAQAVAAEHQFTFGPALLVAPVVKLGARQREVYLPRGIWYDFWTDERLEGGRWVTVEAPLDTIPLFVRGGSLVPMGPEVLFADQRPLDEITLHIYPGGDAAFELYEDDGDTFAFERGAYAKTQLLYSDGAMRRVTITAARGQLDGLPATRTWTLAFHDSHPPALVQVGDLVLTEGAGWTYDAAARTLTVHLGQHPTNEAVTVTVVAQTVSLAAPVLPPELEVEVGPAAEPGRWRVRAYVRNPLRNPDLTADFALTAPPGWQAQPTSQRRPRATGGGIADAWWELTPEPGPTVCAPTVEATARVILGDETITLHGQALLTHAYASSWLVVGPFPNGGKGFEIAYPPEQGVDPQAVMIGRDGEVRWRPLDLHDSFGYVDFTALLSPGVLQPVRDAVAYAACRVWSPDERIVWAELLGEEQLKLWCNGSLVLASERPRLTEPQREPVKLQIGWNTVLVKATRGPQEEFSGRMFGFYFRFVDEAGVPVKELRYTSWQ